MPDFAFAADAFRGLTAGSESLRNRHPLLRRLRWNPLIVAVPLVYLGYTAYVYGFPIGRTAGPAFVAVWFGLSAFDLVTNHRLLNWLYPEDRPGETP